MTPERKAEIEELTTRIRGLAMGFASMDPAELAELERLISRSADLVWFLDPTLARNRGAAIERHRRLVGAAVRFAGEARKLLEEELEELASTAKRAESEG